MISTISGTGVLRRAERIIGAVRYTMHVGLNGQANIVKFDARPPVRDGDLVHLALEDGRVLNCRMLDGSSHCAVEGDGPIVERRSRVRPDDEPPVR
jgi:hypothetical protein